MKLYANGVAFKILHNRCYVGKPNEVHVIKLAKLTFTMERYFHVLKKKKKKTFQRGYLSPIGKTLFFWFKTLLWKKRMMMVIVIIILQIHVRKSAPPTRGLLCLLRTSAAADW